MNNIDSPNVTENKLLKDGPFSGIMVPIAIVLVGALIIFGVTKMLSTDRSHRDLVREMRSKTFGNRWVAAYELSKVISSQSLDEKEKIWLIENLGELYSVAQDPRTKTFIIVALGALNDHKALPILEAGLASTHGDIVFHSVVGIGNMPKGITIDWKKIEGLLDSDDLALKQSALLVLATHGISSSEARIEALLNDSERSIRYAAATGLIYFKNQKALPMLKEILELDSMSNQLVFGFNQNKITSLKINVVNALQKTKWSSGLSLLEVAAEKERNEKIKLRSREVLNKLKN